MSNRLWNPPKKRLKSVQFYGTTTIFPIKGFLGGGFISVYTISYPVLDLADIEKNLPRVRNYVYEGFKKTSRGFRNTPVGQLLTIAMSIPQAHYS
jgi:hypothetical protein